jgi:hypothetical protein
MSPADVVVGIGGAAGDGVASAGNTLALAAARQGMGVYAYNSYQSVIRGGHSWLRMRMSAQKGEWSYPPRCRRQPAYLVVENSLDKLWAPPLPLVAGQQAQDTATRAATLTNQLRSVDR